MNNTDKLSALIKEARPLYKQRKRRRTIAKMMLTAFVPVFIFSTLAGIYIQGSDIYMALDNNKLQYELLQDEFGIF